MTTVNQVGRRQVLRSLAMGSVAGLAGCLSNDADEGDESTDDEDADPYFRQELTNAIDAIDPPDPGSAIVVFENGGEYNTGEIECTEDRSSPNDPDKGSAEGFFEFDDGVSFDVRLARLDDVSDIRNTITLTVPTPDEDSRFETAEVPRSMWPIKPEAGADGRSAFVIREGGTWYGGIGFDLSDIGGTDYGETLVAITCA